MELTDKQKEFLAAVQALSGEKIENCYQCGKCSAGCPMGEQMKMLPNAIVRALQLGNTEVYKEEAIWQCVSCMTCGSRCPKDVKPGKIIEALRELYKTEYGDKHAVESISTRVHEEAPQQALVSALRKFTD